MFRQRRKSKSTTTKLVIEELEGRRVLSSIHDHAATGFLSTNFKSSGQAASDQLSGVTNLSSLTTASSASSSNGVSGSGTCDHASSSSNSLSATLDSQNGSSITGTASFQTQSNGSSTTYTLTIKVSGGTSGEELTVTLTDSSGNSIELGVITIGSDGTGSLTLSSDSSSASSSTSDSTSSSSSSTSQSSGIDLSSIGSSSVISLSTEDSSGSSSIVASGTLTSKTNARRAHRGHAQVTNETKLSGTISDASSSLTGSVKYDSATISGLVISEFTVKLSGGTSDSSYDVSIVDSAGNSVSVGTITADSTGSGSLSYSTHPRGTQEQFPSNFPTISSGYSVVISQIDSQGNLTQVASTTLS